VVGLGYRTRGPLKLLLRPFSAAPRAGSRSTPRPARRSARSACGRRCRRRRSTRSRRPASPQTSSATFRAGSRESASTSRSSSSVLAGGLPIPRQLIGSTTRDRARFSASSRESGLVFEKTLKPGVGVGWRRSVQGFARPPRSRALPRARRQRRQRPRRRQSANSRSSSRRRARRARPQRCLVGGEADGLPRARWLDQQPDLPHVLRVDDDRLRRVDFASFLVVD
jgi:hypothetical protein